jgi:hypothetical protein
MVQKCEFCNIKKVNTLLAFRCRCGLINLCVKCKDDHTCTFDYKENNIQILKKNNPKVIADKLKDKI